MQNNVKDSRYVERLCKELGLNCEFIRGEDTSYSLRVSEKLGISLDNVAKTVVFVNENNEGVAVVVRAIYKIQQNKLAKILGYKRLRLATQEEVVKLTGYIPGGVSPIGLSIKLVFDEELTRCNELWFGGGDRKTLVKVNIKDLIKKVNPTIIEVPKRRIE